MAYEDKLLGPGEEKLYIAHRHALFMLIRAVPPGLIAIVALLAGVIAQGFLAGVSGIPPAAGLAAMIVALVIFLVFGAQVLREVLEWQYERYIVTGRRVIRLHGVINRQALDSSLNMINDLITSQTLWGRMFNFGDIQILTGNDSGEDTIQGVQDPFGFKRALLAAKEQMMLSYQGGYGQTRMMPAVPTAPDTSFAALMRELGDLRDRGVITQAEYDAKAATLVRGQRP